MKKHFIDSMMIEVKKGVSADNGFKSSVWKKYKLTLKTRQILIAAANSCRASINE